MFEIQDRLAQTFLVNNAMERHHRMKWMFTFHFLSSIVSPTFFSVNAGAPSVVMLANYAKVTQICPAVFNTSKQILASCSVFQMF